MTFLKKNSVYFVIIVLFIAVATVPGIRQFVKDQVMMKPAMEVAEKSMTLSPADYDIDLKGINTPDTNLKAFRGRALFLNFWGTWCPPCRSEWPSIQKLYEAQEGKTAFVLIAMEDQEQAVRAFLQKKNYTVPVYIAASPLPAMLLPHSFPTTFILRKDGLILKKSDSAEDWASPASLKFMQDMLQ